MVFSSARAAAQKVPGLVIVAQRYRDAGARLFTEGE
jgi:hypothetical protein